MEIPPADRAILRPLAERVVEVIMKDLSTVRYQPQRLWERAAMAAELTARYA